MTPYLSRPKNHDRDVQMLSGTSHNLRAPRLSKCRLCRHPAGMATPFGRSGGWFCKACTSRRKEWRPRATQALRLCLSACGPRDSGYQASDAWPLPVFPASSVLGDICPAICQASLFQLNLPSRLLRYASELTPVNCSSTDDRALAFVHRVKRLWAVCLRQRSGRSCQCAPERRTHSTPLTKLRLSMPDRPGSPDNKSLILRHVLPSVRSALFRRHRTPDQSTPETHEPHITTELNPECRLVPE